MSVEEPSQRTASPAPEPPEEEKAGRPGPPPGGILSKTPVLVGLLAGGMLAIAFLVAILRGSPASSPSGLEGSGATPPPATVAGEGIQLISPIRHVPHGKLTLNWKPVETYKSYEAVILETGAKLLWQSKPTESTSVTVPQAVVDRMFPGTTYIWYVVGHKQDGTDFQTTSEPFIISK